MSRRRPEYAKQSQYRYREPSRIKKELHKFKTQPPAYPVGLPVGQVITYRCIGQAVQYLAIVTPLRPDGCQWAISTSGNVLRQVWPELVYPYNERWGIGYYDSKPGQSPASPRRIEQLKLMQIQYGQRPPQLTITDLHGHPINIVEPMTALVATKAYSETTPPGSVEYWTDFYQQLYALAPINQNPFHPQFQWL